MKKFIVAILFALGLTLAGAAAANAADCSGCLIEFSGECLGCII